ncbi:Cys-tRNA(Pro) deacylase [Salinibacterium sp. UTAS2018]|uniref:Cys-tRNA(Pro) deacylase n=1 Tax=Salinibacterium sp. UTAS2018 TaxID=2508880 RepID=UPI0010095DE3|nr:Cys-tRNA(Pro) deacylase [Salinibacterium sp. UTAS2018]QAV69804.1 Cys-tRNA(Pro) deacylase [Salinibacterium sp. UTAS2018]
MALGTPATVALDALGITFTAHPYAHDASNQDYGIEAATVLGVSPEQVFKTLMTVVDDEMIVAVVPVSGKLDLKALASTLGGKKATMAEPAVAQRRTGYVLGGISPIGQRLPHRTVIDETVELFETVFVSGGTRGFDIELSPADLLRATDAHVGAIARD